MIVHPNVVTLKEIFLKETTLYLVYEKSDKDLYVLIEEKRNSKERFEEYQIKLLIF